MPQTISLQRGSVTYTANGGTTSNITTLFTNTSSGVGTRVIINYLTVQNPFVTGSGFSYPSATCAGYLGAVSSGTTGTIIGAMSTTGGSMTTFSMPISDAGQAAAGAPANIVSTTPRFYATTPSVNQVGFTTTTPNNIQFSVGNTTVSGYCPRNFWIGPSDVVRWWPISSSYTFPSGKGTASAFYTQTLYYSFTCITES